MNYLNSVSEYQNAIKKLLSDKLGESSEMKTKCEVIFPSAIEEGDPIAPQIIIDNFHFDKVQRAGDGRREAHLNVDLFVRVSSNIKEPELVASDIGFYIICLLENQRYGYKGQTIDAPTDIDGDGIPWSNLGAGYHITFSQVIRIGQVGQKDFKILELQINRVSREGVKRNTKTIQTGKEPVSDAEKPESSGDS